MSHIKLSKSSIFISLILLSGCISDKSSNNIAQNTPRPTPTPTPIAPDTESSIPDPSQPNLGSGGLGGSSGPTPGTGPDTETPPEEDQSASLDKLQIEAVPAFTALTSFKEPVAMMKAPNDVQRWFIVEQQGIVKVFNNNQNTTQTNTFIDISAQVDDSYYESGLLGMAFHPDFQTNGQVFLSYTGTGSPLTSYISRFTSPDNGATLDPNSEKVILTVDQDYSNHNGGHIAFGPDGYLYIGLGDGGSAGDPKQRAQDTTHLLGSMLRIDVDSTSPYAIPPDNPFAGNALCNNGVGIADCPEIFAWGLRNPWRWSFDRNNGDLWLGDVGQSAWEEINVIQKGSNYGWNIWEADSCYTPSANCSDAGLTAPVAKYGRDLGYSVTGGYIYRGISISALQGHYVFGDFGTGRIWALDEDNTGIYTLVQLLDTNHHISSFAEGHNGEIYFLNYNGGDIYQLKNK